MTDLFAIYLKGDWGSLLGAEKSESSNHTCSNQDGARCKTQFFISIGVMAHIYSTYDEQTFRSLLYDNRRIGGRKEVQIFLSRQTAAGQFQSTGVYTG